MNTYRGTGHRRTYVNATSSVIPSNTVVEMTDEIGIVVADIPALGDGEAEVSGLHELPANSSATWDQGDTLYWDDSPGELVATSSTNVPAGVANTAKLSGQTTHVVLLNGRPGQG